MGFQTLKDVSELAASIAAPAQLAVLRTLADRASDVTRIAWPSLCNMGKQTGYRSENTIRSAVAALETKGMISVWRRRGTFSIYCVHPLGLAALPQCKPNAVRDHMGKYFSKTEIGTILAWRALLGAHHGKMAATETYPHPLNPCGGPAGHRKATPSIIEAHPLNRKGGTPSIVEAEPIKNQNRILRAADRPAAMGELPEQPALPPSAPLSPKARNRSEDLKLWRGDPSGVLARVKERGGHEGARFESMDQDDALAAIARQQKVLGFAHNDSELVASVT